MNRFREIFISLAIFAANGLAQTYTIGTIAGTTRLLDGNQATTVPLRAPVSVIADAGGGFYLSDSLDNRIRHVSSTGYISTYAGNGFTGFAGDRGKATNASLNNQRTIVMDPSGNMYIADYGNNLVRRISTDQTINTIAGNGRPTYTGDGQALGIGFSPLSIALDSKSNLLYIADESTYHILKMDLTSGKITAVAGTGVIADPNSGETGPGLSCRIGEVAGMVVDPNGNLYLADVTDARVRKLDPQGNLTTFAGAGSYGTINDGLPAAGAVMLPLDVALDNNGNLLIADINRNLIFRVSLTDPRIFTVAGNGNEGFSGDGGSPLQASLDIPRGLSYSAALGAILFADWANMRVRKIAGTITTVAGTDIHDGGPATSAFLNLPFAVAVDGNRNILVADEENWEAREFTVGGNIRSVGQFNNSMPLAATVDQANDFIVTDSEPAVLKLSPNGSTTVIAGNSQDGYTGDNGPATSASISGPTGVAVDVAGNIYIVDNNNERVRRVSGGIISTFAGNGNILASGDGSGPATAAGMDPYDVAVDKLQNVYIADRVNNRIRKISPDGRSITTVAGTGFPGYSGDGGPATSAEISGPTCVAFDNAGNMYICDRDNAVLRRVTPQGLITTIAGSGVGNPSTGDGGPALAAQLDPWRVAFDSLGNIYVDDASNDRIRLLTPKAVAPVAVKVTGGNNQSANTGVQLSTPIALEVVAATGAGVPGVLVTFTVTPAGSATISPSPAITLNDGTATAMVTLGSTAGTITIQAAAAGVAVPATFTLTATTPVSPTAPTIASGGVVSAGLSVPVVQTLSPNGIATIFGTNFAPAGTAAQVGTPDLVNGSVPTNFAGICVLVGTVRAPIFAVYPGQINFQVPAVAPGNTTAQVITNCDGANSQTSNSAQVTVAATAPEFFYFVTNVNGHDPIAAINATTGAYIGSPGLVSGASFTPAKAGDVLTLFGTGFGATSPSFAAGQLPTVAGSVTASFSLTIGGVAVPSGNILYVGVVGGDAGLYQVNVIVPQNVPVGDDAVVLTIGGVASPAQAYITVGQ